MVDGGKEWEGCDGGGVGGAVESETALQGVRGSLCAMSYITFVFLLCCFCPKLGTIFTFEQYYKISSCSLNMSVLSGPYPTLLFLLKGRGPSRCWGVSSNLGRTQDQGVNISMGDCEAI